MKNKTKITNTNDKYLEESPNKRVKRGSGNISPHGETNSGGNSRGCFGGNSFTDPKSSITKIGCVVKINGEICLEGHYDVNGLPVKGPMKINNLRIYKDGKLVDKLQLIALTPNIQTSEWLNEKRAFLVDEYISNQEASRIKKGYGFVYEHSFFKFK